MKFFPLAALLTLTSCSSLPKSAARPNFDFASIRAVQIKAKDSIAPLISKELLLAGLTPLAQTATAGRADALLVVAVAKEHPEKRYIVRTAKKRLTQQTTASSNQTQTSSTVQFEEDPGYPPVPVSGSQPYTQAVFGDADARLVATYAQAALSAELQLPKSGEVLWAGSYSYEGIDLESALEGAVRGLVRDIPIGRR
ncbi:MAG: hypothetical protein HYT79_11560 [Elusimicrobia bacterium]|nr:hypothetical protein [Elusimicrobiota bacterium]